MGEPNYRNRKEMLEALNAQNAATTEEERNAQSQRVSELQADTDASK